MSAWETGTERDGDGERERGRRRVEVAKKRRELTSLFSSNKRKSSSPFILATSDPQRELLDPALCGTVNLLSSAARENERRRAASDEEEGKEKAEASGTTKKEARRPLRVVLTSSVAAVHGEYEAPPRSGSLYSEEDWNVSGKIIFILVEGSFLFWFLFSRGARSTFSFSLIQHDSLGFASLLSSLSLPSLLFSQETSSVANGQAYHLSKVMAEKEAWRVAEAKGIDLVTVNPNFVLGPALSAAPDGGGSISVSYVKGMVEGSRAASGSPIICDVRDVARAHVVAAENPEAKGRYIVSQPGAVLPEAMAEAVRSAVRDAGFAREAALLPPAEAAPAGETGKARIDARRTVEELGVLLRSPEETLRDAARSLIKLGVAVPASKV